MHNINICLLSKCKYCIRLYVQSCFSFFNSKTTITALDLFWGFWERGGGKNTSLCVPSYCLLVLYRRHHRSVPPVKFGRQRLGFGSKKWRSMLWDCSQVQICREHKEFNVLTRWKTCKAARYQVNSLSNCT